MVKKGLNCQLNTLNAYLSPTDKTVQAMVLHH